jgi:hypothetical protein
MLLSMPKACSALHGYSFDTGMQTLKQSHALRGLHSQQLQCLPGWVGDHADSDCRVVNLNLHSPGEPAALEEQWLGLLHSQPRRQHHHCSHVL